MAASTPETTHIAEVDQGSYTGTLLQHSVKYVVRCCRPDKLQSLCAHARWPTVTVLSDSTIVLGLVGVLDPLPLSHTATATFAST